MEDVCRAFLTNNVNNKTPAVMGIYDDIELTEQEKEAALLEARKKKYFHERHAAYWEAKEAVIKGKTKTTEIIKRS